MSRPDNFYIQQKDPATGEKMYFPYVDGEILWDEPCITATLAVGLAKEKITAKYNKETPIEVDAPIPTAIEEETSEEEVVVVKPKRKYTKRKKVEVKDEEMV